MRLIDADNLTALLGDERATLHNEQQTFRAMSEIEFNDRDYMFLHLQYIIDNAPTVELDENIIQQVLNKRCMTAVTNEYLIALHNNRPTGEWKGFIGSAYYGVDEDNEPIWRERIIYHCSFCNRRTVIKENYCPNCGAKMINPKTLIDKLGLVFEQIAETATNFFEDETISGLLEEGEE